MAYKSFTIEGRQWKGYTDDPENGDPELLGPPSQDIVIDKSRKPKARGGYEATDIDLGQAGKPARSFYVERFNVTVFAVGTKVYYTDHNNSDEKVDTGLSLTDGTVTRFEEYAGQVLLTNTTDGARMLLFTKLNAAVTGGDATISVDVDGAARMDRFDTELSPANKYLRIQGTNEQYASLTPATGVVTLSGTASQGYDNDRIAVVVYDVSSRFPKCEKLVAWKETINCVGVSEASASAASDVPPSALHFSQFATAAAIENMVKLTGGLSGVELVGKAGKLVNAVATRDYLYLFKQNETYYIPVSNVNTVTGARPPILLSSNYGCLNADCAVDMGNGEVAFLTPDFRCIRIKIATDSGAPVVFPDESFDVPYSNTLKTFDAIQPNARMDYIRSQKRMFVQGLANGKQIALPFSNEIGAWEPPRRNWYFASYFERNGQAYATDFADDTVYMLDSSSDDNGLAIEHIMASPMFESEDGRVTCRWQEWELSGDIERGGSVTVEQIVSGGTPQIKSITSSDAIFSIPSAAGATVLADEPIAGYPSAIEPGSYEKRLAIYPSVGSSYQFIMSSSSYFSLSSFLIHAKASTKSLLTLS